MIIECLKVLLLGMLGIFAVMSVIISSTWMLNRINKEKNNEDNPTS